MLRRLILDDAAFVVSAELVLIATILVIGMIVGLATVREQVVQELGDIGVHLARMNQSYSFSGITGHHSSTSGTVTVDQSDDCDLDVFGLDADVPGFPPGCIDIAGVDGVAE